MHKSTILTLTVIITKGTMLQRSLKTKLNKNKIKRLLWVVCCEDVTEHLKCQETPVFSNDTLTRSLISQFVSLD